MKKIIAIFLAPLLFFTSFTPFLETPLALQKAYAEEDCIYYVYDDQGNIRFITDENGAKVRSTEYDPFGNWRAAKGQANIHMLYQSQQQDSESSLYYLRARYYDPLIGRFISKDPIKGSLMNPQTQNPYVYAANNPVNLSDPSGKNVALFLAGGLTLAGLELGGAIYGAATSCGNLVQGAIVGAQNAVESPVGQVALGAAFIGTGIAANTPSKSPLSGKMDQHAVNSMLKRGWTEEEIVNALNNGKSYPAVDKTAGGASATRYVNPDTGKSVVVNDDTGKIIHLGGEDFKY